MLSRFITDASRVSGGDASVATATASGDAAPARTWPLTVTPCAASADRSVPATHGAGSSITPRYAREPALDPIHPRTSMRPSVRRRIVSLALLLPATVRVLLMTGTVLDGGSRLTDVPPLGSGLMTTVARFSFIESADTRAA